MEDSPGSFGLFGACFHETSKYVGLGLVFQKVVDSFRM